MAEAKEAQEPSMEEILASIRRIISDEDSPDEQESAPEPEEDAPMEDGVEMSQDDLDALFDSPSPAEEPDEPEEEEEDLSMEEAMAQEAEEEPEPEPEPEPDLPEPEIVEGLDPDDADISFAEGDVEEEDEDDGPPLDLGPELEVTEPEPAHHYQAIPDGRLDSSEDLAEALLSPTTDAVVSSAFGNLANTILSKNARTLEDLVGELLRPMLKSWLDANLPVIVERLVRKEIERVTRNGGEQ